MSAQGEVRISCFGGWLREESAYVEFFRACRSLSHSVHAISCMTCAALNHSCSARGTLIVFRFLLLLCDGDDDFMLSSRALSLMRQLCVGVSYECTMLP